MNTESIVSRGKKIYEAQKLKFEQDRKGQFVSIEPDSGELFFGGSFDEAVASARESHPEKISYTVRIGHEAAFHIGLMSR